MDAARITEPTVGASPGAALTVLCKVDVKMMHQGDIAGREWLERATRVEVSYGLTVGYPGGSADAELINLSSEGFRLRCREPLESGWEVTLKAGRDDALKALIVWACGLDAGGVFAEPIAL